MDKPFKGRITDWRLDECHGGLGYLIRGQFLDHEEFKGMRGHTSYIVAHNKTSGEIETRNSRYLLVGEGELPE